MHPTFYNKKKLHFLARKPPFSIRVQFECTPKQFKNNAFRPPTDPGARRVHGRALLAGSNAGATRVQSGCCL